MGCATARRSVPKQAMLASRKDDELGPVGPPEGVSDDLEVGLGVRSAADLGGSHA